MSNQAIDRSISDTNLRFCNDDDILSFYAGCDNGNGTGIDPRTDRFGNPITSWDHYIQKAMNHVFRNLRSRKDVAEPLDLGRLGLRTQARLREAVALVALFYMFLAKSQPGAEWIFERARLWLKMGEDIINAETIQMDYDYDNDGIIDFTERNQPFPIRVIRG